MHTMFLGIAIESDEVFLFPEHCFRRRSLTHGTRLGHITVSVLLTKSLRSVSVIWRRCPQASAGSRLGSLLCTLSTRWFQHLWCSVVGKT